MSLSLIISHYQILDTLASHIVIPAAPRTGGAVSSSTGKTSQQKRRFVHLDVGSMVSNELKQIQHLKLRGILGSYPGKHKHSDISWYIQTTASKTTLLDRKHIHWYPKKIRQGMAFLRNCGNRSLKPISQLPKAPSWRHLMNSKYPTIADSCWSLNQPKPT